MTKFVSYFWIDNFVHAAKIDTRIIGLHKILFLICLIITNIIFTEDLIRIIDFLTTPVEITLKTEKFKIVCMMKILRITNLIKTHSHVPKTCDRLH